MRLDGSSYQIINKVYPNCIAVKGEWIYYVTGLLVRSLYKVRTDGTGCTKIGACSACRMTIYKHWIFYVDYSTRKLCKMQIDGTNKCTVLNIKVGYIKIVDEWLYFWNEDTKSYYRMKPGGTALECLNNRL
jgi:hypothetical protein